VCGLHVWFVCACVREGVCFYWWDDLTNGGSVLLYVSSAAIRHPIYKSEPHSKRHPKGLSESNMFRHPKAINK